jgi:hypothetical protein
MALHEKTLVSLGETALSVISFDTGKADHGCDSLSSTTVSPTSTARAFFPLISMIAEDLGLWLRSLV